MKFIPTLLLTLISELCYPQINLTINGTAPLLKDGTEISFQQIVPSRLQGSNKKIITRVKNHRFEFILSSDQGQLYYIWGNKGGSRIFLQPGEANIIIVDSILRQVTVPGNTANMEYAEYGEQIEHDSLYQLYVKAFRDYYTYTEKNKNAVSVDNKKQKIDSLQFLINKQSSVVCFNWIKQHPNSSINTLILNDQVQYLSEDEVKQVFRSMPARVVNDVWGREIKYRIDSLFVGGTAPGFSQADTNGRQVSLASFRGKYVLLDFWASWCVPCREENPAVVKAMAKYRNRKFTILSISFDENRDAWLKAIKQDDLNWTHLSELKAWKNALRFKYYINSIPSNYLIDPNGKIVAKNLRGDELNAVLGKLLSN